MTRERRLTVLDALVRATTECERNGKPDRMIARYALQYGRSQRGTESEIASVLGMTVSAVLRQGEGPDGAVKPWPETT